MELITPTAGQRGIAQIREHRLCFPRRAVGLFGVPPGSQLCPGFQSNSIGYFPEMSGARIKPL